MKKTKLHIIWNSLSISEQKEFEKFIRSPYFNENSRLVDLYVLLRDYPAKNKEEVWKKICPEVRFNDIQFRRWCADLTKLIQEFLGVSAYRKLNVRKGNDVLAVLNDRDLDKHFLSVERNLRSLYEKNNYRDATYFMNRYALEQHVDNFQVKSIQLTKQVNLGTADKMLDCYFLTQKLKNYCNALNYKNVLNLDIELSLIAKILPVLRKEGYLEVPSIAIYYKIAKTLLEPEQFVHFYDLKKLLTTHSSLFPPLEIRDMFIFAQNYCIKKINKGNVVFYKELFEIYQAILAKGIILKNGELLPWDYKNIVSLGLRLKEYNWIEAFIKEQNERLPADFRANALTYNMANLHFHKGNYDKVISLLREVVYQDLYYALDGRWLLLKTYFELSELDAMESLLESFRLFLLRNRLLSKTNQRQYLNLVRFAKKLIRLNTKDKQKVAKLRSNIEEAKEVAERRWLIEKLPN